MKSLSPLAILLASACSGYHSGPGEHTPPPPPPAKTPIDLALGCLEMLSQCDDWTPGRADLPPRECPSECDTVDFDCRDAKRDCERQNRLDRELLVDSACQRKAFTCIRLVEASAPNREIHHHGS